MYENTIHVAIKPELIYIFDENKYIKLISPQGDQYIYLPWSIRDINRDKVKYLLR